MAKTRVLVQRRKAVRNIRKITRTMELIATSRFQKALVRAVEAEAFTRKIGELAADLARNAGSVTHPLMEKREMLIAGIGGLSYATLNAPRGTIYGWVNFAGLEGKTVPAEASETANPYVIASPADAIEPIWEYSHTVGKSITGGLVYRGRTVPELVGGYLYADFVTGKLWALWYDNKAGRVTANRPLLGNVMPVMSFGEDQHGEAYFTLDTGQIQVALFVEVSDDQLGEALRRLVEDAHAVEVPLQLFRIGGIVQHVECT